MNALIVCCYFIMAYGLTNLLVNGRGPYDLLTSLRDNAKVFMPGLGEMLDCMMCTSTNVGLVMSVISMNAATPFTPFTVLFPEAGWLLVLLFDMFATSGAVWFIDAVELFFERLGEKAMSETGYVTDDGEQLTEEDVRETLNQMGENRVRVGGSKHKYLTFTQDTDTLSGKSAYIITTTDGSMFRYYIDMENVNGVEVEKDGTLTVGINGSAEVFNFNATDVEVFEDWGLKYYNGDGR